jgi:hypothetical protein
MPFRAVLIPASGATALGSVLVSALSDVDIRPDGEPCVLYCDSRASYFSTNELSNKTGVVLVSCKDTELLDRMYKIHRIV